MELIQTSKIVTRVLELCSVLALALLLYPCAAVSQAGVNFSNDSFRFIDLNDIVSSEYQKDSTLSLVLREGDWFFSERVIYNYDYQGKELNNVFSVLEDGQWKLKTKIEKSYDSSHFLTYERESIWDSEQVAWSFAMKRNYHYNSIGLKDDEIVFIRNEDFWEKFSRFNYLYNYSNLIEEQSEFNWNVNNSEWEAKERRFYSYNDEDFLKEEIVQIWNDSLGSWVNSISKSYEYDDMNNLVSTVRSNWSNSENEWIGYSMISLTYDDDGKLKSSRPISLWNSSNPGLVGHEANYDDNGNVGEIILSNWNEEQGEWLDYKKQVHFWSEKIQGNLEEGTDEIRCNFMNPYILGLSWSCPYLKEGINYTIELYDLNGRLRYSDQIIGNSVFRIDGNIDSGFYTVVISGGLDVYSEKIIVRE